MERVGVGKHAWLKVFDFADFIADGSESLFSVSTTINNFGIRKMLLSGIFYTFLPQMR